MDIAKEFIQRIDAMSDAEFEALIASVSPLREHSISVDEYLRATEQHVNGYQYALDFPVEERPAQDLALAA